MDADREDLKPLEPGQLWVMRIGAWTKAAVFLVLAIAGEVVVSRTTALPFGLVLAGVILLLLWPAFVAPDRRFHAYRWKTADEELHLHRGVLTKVETIVPFVRVQHIDISRSALERAFHVASLVLHTAGTIDHRVTVPGLSRETAERVRDDVRAVIAREADER